MFGINEVILAILQGAAGSLTSRLTESREDPVRIDVIINDAVKELEARDEELEVSIAEISKSLMSLKELLKNLPEFDVKPGNIVVLIPPSENPSGGGLDLGDVLYRLDEKIADLRMDSVGSSHERYSPTVNQEIPVVLTHVPEILKGLDEEIEALRNGSSGTGKTGVKKNGRS